MSSKRQLRRKECSRKVACLTYKHARRGQLWHEHTFGADLGIYRCPWCDRFHLAHAPAEERRTRRNFDFLPQQDRPLL
jgi:hypothetical protein